jgi:CHRD domain-containing protein
VRNARVRLAVVVAVVGVVVVAAVAVAYDRGSFEAKLSGAEEVPFVSTDGKARFEARLSRDRTEIDWELSYGDLSGTPTQAHIHLGQERVNGGIVLWFCANTPPVTPPATIPTPQPCPPGPARIEGTWTAADVHAQPTQGIAGPPDFGEVIRAMRIGVTYANVHTEQSPGGEVRGQVSSDRRSD